MGAKWLFRWRPTSAAQQAGQEKVLISALSLMGIKPSADRSGGKFEVRCQLLRQHSPALQSSTQHQVTTLKDVWLVHVPDVQEAVYMINRGEGLVMETDVGVVELLEKRIAYKSKTAITINGHRLLKGDFVLQLGWATQEISGAHGSVMGLGLVLEIEYKPVRDAQVAGPFLADLLELVQAYIPRAADGTPLGALEPLKPSFSNYASLPSGAFSNQHSAVQYTDLCIALLQQQQQQQQQ